MKNEVKVGIISMIIIIVFIFILIQISGTQVGKNTYEVKVIFDYVGALNENSPVRIAGVKAGRVKEIKLVESKPLVILEIDGDKKLRKGAAIKISVLGIIGENYIEIGVGDEYQPFYTKEELKEPIYGKAPVNVSDIMEIVGKLEFYFRDITSGVNSLTGKLNALIDENRENLAESVGNIRQISEKAITLIDDISEVADSLSGISDVFGKDGSSLKKMMDDLYETSKKLNTTTGHLSKIVEDINQGKGTLGKIIKDEKFYNDLDVTLNQVRELSEGINRLKTYWEYSGLYNQDAEGINSKFSFIIEPRENKEYYFGVTEYEIQGEDPTFDFLLGLTWKSYYLGAGMIESSGGVKTGINFVDNKLQLRIEGFQLSDEERDNANLRASVNIRYLKNFALRFEGCDLLEDPFYRAGLSIRFEDEDLKYIIGFMALAFTL
jgi:phospholipid/cholesterol/gamma-HCH transport system substrate-binding protein